MENLTSVRGKGSPRSGILPQIQGGQDPHDIATILSIMGDLFVSQRRHNDALVVFRRALKLRCGQEHPHIRSLCVFLHV